MMVEKMEFHYDATYPVWWLDKTCHLLLMSLLRTWQLLSEQQVWEGLLVPGLSPVLWTLLVADFAALSSKPTLKHMFSTVFKRVVNHYRGMTVLNSIAKLYDMVLCNTLNQWYKPHRQQAGSQPGGRGMYRTCCHTAFVKSCRYKQDM